MNSAYDDSVYDGILERLEHEHPDPAEFGLPKELAEESGVGYSAWWVIQSGYASLMSKINDGDDSIDDAVSGFAEYMSSTTRMSLTVPVYLPEMVRGLAGGPRQMNDAVISLVTNAYMPKHQETQGALESLAARVARIEAALSA